MSIKKINKKRKNKIVCNKAKKPLNFLPFEIEVTESLGCKLCAYAEEVTQFVNENKIYKFEIVFNSLNPAFPYVLFFVRTETGF
jgi:hypothetical protein